MRLIAELVYGERFLHFFYHIDSKLRQPCPHASSSAGADHRAMFSLGNGYNIGGGRRGITSGAATARAADLPGRPRRGPADPGRVLL